ncbi:hypothetical protein SynMINOS11_02550 [Synechococcus sp. Minos11]|uniref:hypothetical protein n=1 Tax=Synechococcus sp. Minos11 TaxID=221341 RepID=UPI0016489897|nr:hypothetical protein [Synechococcus sp. Minos11]QNJ09991.1 hypothetical protein SynMINOS11_02550 [Synechococcus sp. Minos11]
MPKKLTKHQRQYRKRKKDGQRDFRTVKKDGPWNGVRVTRRRLKVNVSQEAYERLSALAKAAGLELWAMLTRMILKGLPRYASHSTSDSPLHRYIWPTIRPPKSFKYKGTSGDKQLSYDITSTAANKLECHKNATGYSKARIVQTLILSYNPTPAHIREANWWDREAERLADDSDLASHISRKEYEERKQERARYSTRKFICLGGFPPRIEHKKLIPMKQWDEQEWFEYYQLMYRISHDHWQKWKEETDHWSYDGIKYWCENTMSYAKDMLDGRLPEIPGD